ncbi:ABC transporter substrate-binding protein [Halalkalibacter kiskunsagensis]|uniref:ABC transporter substrate-binding protein n=1 Tax=Halalkalibacter kiskunsagensis TaxID=1548599 RepID=A0ABV6KME9_9BACI
MIKSGKRVFLFLVMFVLLALTACSSGTSGGPNAVNDPDPDSNTEVELEEGQIELRVAWWGSQTRHDRTLEAIELFEEQNPNIVVTPEFTGWDGYWERLATQAAGQNLPDVFQMDLQYLNEYVSRGLLEDLGPLVESGHLNLDDVDELYLTGGRIDDDLYAINLGANSLAIAYDPAMFEEAGVPVLEPGYSWDDYLSTSRALKEKLGDDVYVQSLSDLHGFKHYLRQHDLWLYNEDNTGLGYDDDQYFIDYFSMWNDLLREEVSAGPDITSEIQGLEDELIVHGRSPVLMFHSNQIVGLQRAADRPLEMALFPSMPGKTDAHFLKPSQFFSITSQSQQQEAAAEFIDFITNSLEANDILAAERGVPISEAVREHLYPQLSEYEQMQFDYIELVQENSSEIHAPEPAGLSEINGLFDRKLEELEYGVITVEEFAQEFREGVEQILGN